MVHIANDFAKTCPSIRASTMAALFAKLLDFQMVKSTPEFDQDQLAVCCRQALILHKSLGWRLKPKAHMFQELCEYVADLHGNPANYWCYRDESFVGFVASAASSRGGGRMPATMALSVLQRFRALSGVA